MTPTGHCDHHHWRASHLKGHLKGPIALLLNSPLYPKSPEAKADVQAPAEADAAGMACEWLGVKK